MDIARRRLLHQRPQPALSELPHIVVLFDGAGPVCDGVGDAEKAVDGVAADDEAEGAEDDEEDDEGRGDGEALVGGRC